MHNCALISPVHWHGEKCVFSLELIWPISSWQGNQKFFANKQWSKITLLSLAFMLNKISFVTFLLYDNDNPPIFTTCHGSKDHSPHHHHTAKSIKQHFFCISILNAKSNNIYHHFMNMPIIPSYAQLCLFGIFLCRFLFHTWFLVHHVHVPSTYPPCPSLVFTFCIEYHV